MCVALPARITWIGRSRNRSVPARAVVGDGVVEVDLLLVPEAKLGDHVIVHAGYAVSVIDEATAGETASLLTGDDR